MIYQNKHLILIVDDDKEDRKLIKMALNFNIDDYFKKFDVETVSSPEEMMNKIKKIDIKFEYSLIILLDIKMPGLDGFDALKMIRKDNSLKHIPVIIMSSTSSNADIIASYKLGANSFITKKTEFDDLVKDMSIFKKYWLKIVHRP